MAVYLSIMACPNHHTNESVMTFVADGTFLRPVLACGCTPTQDELEERLPPCALPDEVPEAATIIEVDQIDPAMIARIEEERVRILVSKILTEAHNQGIDVDGSGKLMKLVPVEEDDDGPHNQ